MKHILHVHIQLLEWNEKSYKTSSLHKRSFPEMLDDTEYPLKQYIVFFLMRFASCSFAVEVLLVELNPPAYIFQSLLLFFTQPKPV